MKFPFYYFGFWCCVCYCQIFLSSVSAASPIASSKQKCKPLHTGVTELGIFDVQEEKKNMSASPKKSNYRYSLCRIETSHKYYLGILINDFVVSTPHEVKELKQICCKGDKGVEKDCERKATLKYLDNFTFLTLKAKKRARKSFDGDITKSDCIAVGIDHELYRATIKKDGKKITIECQCGTEKCYSDDAVICDNKLAGIITEDENGYYVTELKHLRIMIESGVKRKMQIEPHGSAPGMEDTLDNEQTTEELRRSNGDDSLLRLSSLCLFIICLSLRFFTFFKDI